MPNVTKDCNGCGAVEKGHDRLAGTNGYHSAPELGDIADITKVANQSSADELLVQLRNANKQIVLQSQRIEELESYLSCIVTLSAKVRELELDASL